MHLNGYFDAAVYVIMTAISFVFLNKFCQQVDPATALFVMSFIAIITFNLMSLKQIKPTYVACLNNKLLYLVMSGALALDWICMLYSSYITDPFVSMAGLFIFLAIIGFSRLFIKNRSLSNLISIMMLIMSVLLLYFVYHVNSLQYLGLGIMLGGVAGMAFYVYIASSGKLVKLTGLSTMQILATRFWVLFISLAFFVSYHNLWSIILDNMLPLILISFTSLIFPTYFNQQAIKKLGSAITAICISFVPPCIYVFYAIYNDKVIWGNAIVCLMITIALVLPYVIRLLSSRK